MVTAETVAVKVALVAPAATVTLAGTVADALLLASVTAMPLVGAAAVRVSVQLSVPSPVNDALLQERLESIGVTFVAIRLMETDLDCPLRVAVTVAL